MKKTHIPCILCGSSDAATDYGSYIHCYSCNERQYKKKDKVEEIVNSEKKPIQGSSKILPVSDTFERIGSRNISKEACEKYGVWLKEDGSHVYPYYSTDCKTHTANKIRKSGEKSFYSEGEISKTALFGQPAFNSGGKFLTIVEGEVDALSVYDLFGQKYPSVSIQNAQTAERDCSTNFEYINSFETIVICFDKDEAHFRPDGTSFYPGQEAALKVAALFPLGKVKILTLKEYKDANDYLKNNKKQEFKTEWWQA